MFFSRLFFLLLTLISIFIQSPLTHAMEEGNVPTPQVRSASPSFSIGDATPAQIFNSLNSLLNKIKTNNLNLKSSLEHKAHQQIIKEIVNVQNQLIDSADQKISQLSLNNLSEDEINKLKKNKSDFNESKYKFITVLKKPLADLDSALLPGAWKELLKFQTEKSVNLDKLISSFYNDQLYAANYAALIYLNLILEHQSEINEIRAMQKNIAEKKLKVDDIKNPQEYALKLEELNADKKQLEDKRKLFKKLLAYLESAIDYGSLAQKYLAHYKQKVDSALKNDHFKLTLGFGDILLSIDPEVLEKDSAKNEAKREQWKQKTRSWLELLQKSPRRSQTSQDFKKQSKQVRKESKAEEK